MFYEFVICDNTNEVSQVKILRTFVSSEMNGFYTNTNFVNVLYDRFIKKVGVRKVTMTIQINSFEKCVKFL